jgi:hypothetical protein
MTLLLLDYYFILYSYFLHPHNCGVEMYVGVHYLQHKLFTPV